MALDRVVVFQHLLGCGAIGSEAEAVVGVGEAGDSAGGFGRGEFAGKFERGGGGGFGETVRR